MISHEMTKVEKQTKYNSLSDFQKFKLKMLKDNEKVTNRDI